ncbi:hypothetical protein D9C73_000131 [Collichthys lucidus]|uniref:Uncharacterized protein n=1 Tax=Collichthys lucidus TaxID=240159 RepID=A0A4U5U018_COLLU|nr:hypothetical protein D9C73_000131 [Collichthys lucidus]
MSATSLSPVIPAGQPPRRAPSSDSPAPEIIHLGQLQRHRALSTSQARGEPVSVAGQTPATPDTPLQPLPIQTRQRPADPLRGVFTRATAARPSATGMADWTVASLKRQLTQHNIPFLHSDRKATLFRHLRNLLQNSTSRNHFRVAAAATMTSLHRLRLSPLIQPLPRASIPVPTSNVPLPSTAPPPQQAPAPSLSIPPLPSNHSLATAHLQHAPRRPRQAIPVSSALRQQILRFPRPQVRAGRLPVTHHRLALRFGGNGFYSYHTLFASQAAERLHQFNQGTYWGTLDIELYCRTFAARPSLHCDQCGAPSHSATTCSITTQLPRTSIPQKHNQTVSRNLSPAAPPPSITPKPAAPQSASLGPAPKGVNRRGRPILYQGGRILCNNFNDLGKTNQSGQPQPVYLFRLNSPLSPYEPLLNYINSRLACQASPLDPLFISETGRVATRSWFHHHFRQILLRSGIPPEPYSGHRSSLHRFQTGHTRQYHQNARPLGLDRVPSLRPKRPERHPKRTRASLHMKFSLGALIRRVAERRFPPLRVSIPPGSSQDSSGQPQDHSADGPASSLLLPFFPLPHPFTPHPFIPRPSSLHPSTPIPSSPLTLPQHITHAS